MKHRRSCVAAALAAFVLFTSSAGASPVTPQRNSSSLLEGMQSVLKVATVSGLVAPVSVMMSGPALGAALLPVLTTVAVTPTVADNGAGTGSVSEFLGGLLGSRSWHMFRASTRLWLG